MMMYCWYPVIVYHFGLPYVYYYPIVVRNHNRKTQRRRDVEVVQLNETHPVFEERLRSLHTDLPKKVFYPELDGVTPFLNKVYEGTAEQVKQLCTGLGDATFTANSKQYYDNCIADLNMLNGEFTKLNVLRWAMQLKSVPKLHIKHVECALGEEKLGDALFIYLLCTTKDTQNYYKRNGDWPFKVRPKLAKLIKENFDVSYDIDEKNVISFTDDKKETTVSNEIVGSIGWLKYCQLVEDEQFAKEVSEYDKGKLLVFNVDMKTDTYYGSGAEGSGQNVLGKMISWATAFLRKTSGHPFMKALTGVKGLGLPMNKIVDYSTNQVLADTKRKYRLR